jgi:hypothetical protein
MRPLLAVLVVVVLGMLNYLELLALEGRVILVETVMLAAAAAAEAERAAQVITAAVIQHRERVVWVLTSHLDLEYFTLAAAVETGIPLGL